MMLLYFELTPRGALDVKNKGQLSMYFLNGLKPEFSLEMNNVQPNKKLIAALTGTTSAWKLPK